MFVYLGVQMNAIETAFSLLTLGTIRKNPLQVEQTTYQI